MMWVCRPGQKGIYLEKFMLDKRVYLSWQGFNIDLSKASTREDFRRIVIEERNPESRTTISNWAGQLYSFCHDMQIGDMVLIPHRSSKKYALAKIVGDYEYRSQEELVHSRKIEIIRNNIPREIFNQSTQYSLGAFRTLFKVRDEEVVMDAISSWKE